MQVCECTWHGTSFVQTTEGTKMYTVACAGARTRVCVCVCVCVCACVSSQCQTGHGPEQMLTINDRQLPGVGNGTLRVGSRQPVAHGQDQYYRHAALMKPLLLSEEIAILRVVYCIVLWRVSDPAAPV